MVTFVMKLPDIGEGIAEAELVEWNVGIGDFVKEDQVLATVMTDKVTVEIPSSAAGKVVWLGTEAGQQLVIGGDLIRLDIEAAENEDVAVSDDGRAAVVAERTVLAGPMPVNANSEPSTVGGKPLAAPAIRNRARQAGVDLQNLRGTGESGQITHADLDAHLLAMSHPQAGATSAKVREIKVMGLRRKIAERMANAKRRIPHITIVEEIDVTELEKLRAELNAQNPEGLPKLTILPFVMMALADAVREYPSMNAHFDDEKEIVRQFTDIHIGFAAHTEAGLLVPVVRNCDSLTVWSAAAEVARLAEVARKGAASREELSGSTISISSLGPLGAIATTPIINHPEVAIIGINRVEIRPRWNGFEFVPREMMNISSSFDHRIIDGWDAAIFVKHIKSIMEDPDRLSI